MPTPQAPIKPIIVTRRRVHSSPLLLVAFTWAVFTAALIGTNLIANINWATPRLESEISKITNRHVTLGRVSWHMGWDGLYVATERSIVNEKNGTPFMISGPSEIGVSTFELLRGKIAIRRFAFKDPEFWAVEIEPGKWNFEDLIGLLEQVSSLHVENGKLHLVHRAAFAQAHEAGKQVSVPSAISIARSWVNRWRRSHMTQDSEEIFLDLVKPEKDKDWPMTLSLSIPKEGFKTRVSLNLIGHGLLRDWEANKYRFELGADNVDAAELQFFSKSFAGLKGRFNVSATGEGIYQRGGYHIMANARATDITFPTGDYGTVTLSNGSGVAEMFVDPQILQIRRMNLRTSSFYANVAGLIKEWRTDTPTYDVKVASRIYDLGELAKVIPAKIIPPGFTAEYVEGKTLSLAQLLEPARLTGEGKAVLTIKGTDANPRVIGDIDLTGISTTDLFGKGPLKRFSMLSLLSDEPIRVKTGINILDGKTLVSNSQIYAGDSIIIANGAFALKGGDARMNFLAKELDLSSMARNLARNPDALQELYKYIWLPGGTTLALGGEVDVWGSMETGGRGVRTAAGAELRNVLAEISDGSLIAQKVNGRARLVNNVLAIDKMTGYLGKGPFELAGVANLSVPLYDMRVHARNTQMVHAKRLMQVLKIDQPMLQMLSGEVREVFLAVRGTPSNPQISMTAMPASISFKIPFSTQTVTVTGGTVRSDNNAVAFSNVKGTLGRGGFTLNGGVGFKPVTVYNLAINATNADIGDTNRLLAALRIDVPLLRTLTGSVRTANLRIAGSGSNPAISMVSTPSSVYIPLINTTHRIHVTSGVVRSDPRGLGFTDVGGTIGSGTFKLNGNVQLAPTQNYNINIVAYNTDLTDTKHLLETLHIAEPMLANLSGTVREARLSIKGSPDSPIIAMVAKPKSIYARIPNTKEMVHITGGEIAMDAGTVTFTRTTGEIGGNSFTINGMASLPPTQILDLHVTTGRVDLADAQKLLAALKVNIPMMNMVKLSGTISSSDIHIRGNMTSPEITLSAVPENIQFETTDKRHNLKISSGGISLKDGRLVVNKLSITSPHSRLVADLIVENLFTKPHLTLLRANIPSFELADLDFFLTSPAMPELVRTVLDAYQISNWHGVISGNVNIEDRAGVYNFAGDLRAANVGGYLAIHDKRYRLHDINGRVAGNGPAEGVATIAGGIGRSAFTLNARAAGTAGAMPVWKGLVSARIDPTEYLDAVPIKPAYVLWKLADGRPIPAEAKFTLSLGSPGSLNVEASQIAVGDYALRGAGKYEWFGKQSKQEPRLSFEFSLSQPIELQRLAQIAQLKNIPTIGGSVNAVVKIEGPLSKIHTDGYLALCNVSLPDYQIAGITGKVIPVEIKAPSTTTGPFKMTAMLELNSMQVRKLQIGEIRGDLYVARAGSSGPLTLMLQDLEARTADGVITADASVDLSKTFRFDIDLHAKCLAAEQLAEGLFDAGDEITGTVSGQTVLCGAGTTREEFLRNLNGSGRFNLAKGSVKQFGQLEWKLGLASALKRLSIGSLLSSLAPKTTSKFDTMNVAYSINKGTLCLQDFRYCGPGLRLNGNGSLDLICETIRIKMAGEIPKSDNPPVFTFAIDAPLKDDDAIASSIKDTLDFQNKDSQQSPYPVLAVPPEAVPLPPNTCPSPRREDIAEGELDRAQIMNQVSIQPPKLLFNPQSNISRAFSRFREAAHEMAEEIRNTSASQAIPTRMGQVLPPTIVH